MDRIRISDRAERELEELSDYVAEHGPGDPAAILDAIYQTLLVIAANPRMGRLRDDLLPDLRLFPARRPAQRYIIFYHPTDEGIEVNAVIHSARNWEALF